MAAGQMTGLEHLNLVERGDGMGWAQMTRMSASDGQHRARTLPFRTCSPRGAARRIIITSLRRHPSTPTHLPPFPPPQHTQPRLRHAACLPHTLCRERAGGLRLVT
eukprot:3363529-Rhodomonas_salina.1